MLENKRRLEKYNAKQGYQFLASKYGEVIDIIKKRGAYIWGCGKFGLYAKRELEKAGIAFLGYVDNDERKQSEQNKIYSPQFINAGDAVIIATTKHPEIERQMGAKMKYIYYEQFSCMGGVKHYNETFFDIFEEVEGHKREYLKIREKFKDELSRDIFDYVILYRMTLNADFLSEAHKLSSAKGIQDFDECITKRVENGNYDFYDVGGYEGETTLEFVRLIPNYRHIYFFEPDEVIYKNAVRRLKIRNISLFNTAVGQKEGMVSYESTGGQGGKVTDSGEMSVSTIALDQFIERKESYIKMDIEGYEREALLGMKNAIKKYKPLLGISVYHLPGDIHLLSKLILEWNPDYQIIFRHYTDSVADSMMYFV